MDSSLFSQSAVGWEVIERGIIERSICMRVRIQHINVTVQTGKLCKPVSWLVFFLLLQIYYLSQFLLWVIAELDNMLNNVKVYESICSLRNEFGCIIYWLIFSFFRTGNSFFPSAPQIINITYLLLVYLIFLIKTDFLAMHLCRVYGYFQYF